MPTFRSVVRDIVAAFVTIALAILAEHYVDVRLAWVTVILGCLLLVWLHELHKPILSILSTWTGYLPIAEVVLVFVGVLFVLWIVFSLSPEAQRSPALDVKYRPPKGPEISKSPEPQEPRPDSKHLSFSSVPSSNQAKIRVDDITAVLAGSGQPNPAPWSAFNVNYKNIGELPADEIANMYSWTFQSGELSPETVIVMQDELLSNTKWETSMLARKGVELYKEDKGQFFSIPSSRTDEGFSKIQEYFATADVNKKFYIFVTFKYRDRSMTPNVRGVTERCSYIVGNGGALHVCGRNRTFLEQFTPHAAQSKQQ